MSIIDKIAPKGDVLQPFGRTWPELQQRFESIFMPTEEDTDYTVASIKRAFKDIGKPVPEIVLKAHKLINYNPTTPTQRAELLVKMYAFSERLGIMHTEWSRFVDALELALTPPMYVEGEKLTVDERKIQAKSKIAKFKTVSDILMYLTTYCGKVGPSIHQSILNLERDFLKNNN